MSTDLKTDVFLVKGFVKFQLKFLTREEKLKLKEMLAMYSKAVQFTLPMIAEYDIRVYHRLKRFRAFAAKFLRVGVLFAQAALWSAWKIYMRNVPPRLKRTYVREFWPVQLPFFAAFSSIRFEKPDGWIVRVIHHKGKKGPLAIAVELKLGAAGQILEDLLLLTQERTHYRLVFVGQDRLKRWWLVVPYERYRDWFDLLKASS